MKALRITLLTLVGIIILALAAAAVFVATFDANRYKPEIERLVLDRTGRMLTIDGDIELTLLPKLGAKLGQITLSDKDPKEPFLTIESSAVSVALMPLISRQVLIDGVSIHGLDLAVTRSRGGAFNFDDLLATPTDAAAAPAAAASDTTTALMIDISSIDISRANVRYRDLKNELDVDLSDLQLKTGRIAPQSSGRLEMSGQVSSSSLALHSKISATSDYVLKLDAQSVALNQLAVKMGGNWQDIESIDASLNLNLIADLAANTARATDVKAVLKAQQTGQSIEAQLSTSQLDSSSQAGSQALTFAPTEGRLSLTAPNRRIQSDMKLPAFEFAQERLTLKGLSTNTTINDPALGKEALVVQAAGDLALDLKKEVLGLSLTGQFDGSPVTARLNTTGFAKPAITFDVALDQLKLDRFTQGATEGSSGPGNTQTSQKSGATGNQNSAIDLSALQGHNVRGKLRVGQVLSKGMTIEEVQTEIALSQGRLSAAPISAQLFGGKLSGSLSVDSNKNLFAIKQTVSRIRLESLLTAIGQDPKVTGLGTLNLDITTRGTSTPALTQNLAGTASVNLRDGAIKGIDIGAILARVRAMLGKAPQEDGQATGQTTFTEMSATATIEKGIATNRDLIVRAPAFRVEGNGTINIPASSLDYAARVAVVQTSAGQDGADLASLRGVTVPIRITGPFDKLRYQVDVASLAAELAKSKLGDRARDEVNKVVPGLGDALKGLFGR